MPDKFIRQRYNKVLCNLQRTVQKRVQSHRVLLEFMSEKIPLVQ